VDNDKVSHGRANGEYREILLYGIEEEDLAKLLHFMNIVGDFVDGYSSEVPRYTIAKGFYKAIQQTLRQTAMDKDTPRPSLYSTRHQAIANAKRSGMSPREIAAMFGHVSTRTAQRHYGRKAQGWQDFRFRPSPESVAAVTIPTARINTASPSPEVMALAKGMLTSVPPNLR
jgi:hypothetical protein